MTVKELKKALENCDDDQIVQVDFDGEQLLSIIGTHHQVIQPIGTQNKTILVILDII